MCDCGASSTPGAGPFATGRTLVEFVLNAHGGRVAGMSIPDGGLVHVCQGCGATVLQKSYVDSCPVCSGVHAVSPPRATDPSAIQFAGADFTLPRP